MVPIILAGLVFFIWLVLIAVILWFWSRATGMARRHDRRPTDLRKK